MGKRVAVVSETDKNAALAEGAVKRFTGGDKVKARKLYSGSGGASIRVTRCSW